MGAVWDGHGVNFALFSERATQVELCLFDRDDPGREVDRFRLREVSAYVWHGYIPGPGPGQPYGYRVHGPWRPAAGLRFNPNKLLIDPYARALRGQVQWDAPVHGHVTDRPDGDLVADGGDDDWGVPKALVIDPAFDWGDDRPPRTPWHRTVIYEVHVKGFTQRHPEIPASQRGTYAGLAHPAAIDYLKGLGVTAVELMPVHAIVDEERLVKLGLRNYWGYNTIGYFAPEARYCSRGDRGEQVDEFKTMVRALHRAGIEVILDVVYNHTGEGNHVGPTLAFRGIDNPAYYRLVAGNERYYFDYTGTGNTMNVQHPQVLKLIMDSLRYWVTEMHVDGFRFDLASALARELHSVDRLSSFFDVIHQDPVVSQVKLIAEPWDLGEGGYQVGNFPQLWTEWNGKYRDSVRRFWRGDYGSIAELGYRLTGSSDLYADDGRRPSASINFVTAHDGFTLRDLVSYDRKHNEANGEGNRDGVDDNISWNHGVEGETSDPATLALRAQQQRNFIATLFFAQGVPMLCGGDEIGRTQRGNNNAYCQDNEVSWHDWSLDVARERLLAFTRRVIALRQAYPNLRRRRFFQGRPIRGSRTKDVTWLRSDGAEMIEADWHAGWLRCLGMLLGDRFNEVDESGEPIVDHPLLMVMNAHDQPVSFVLPESRGRRWEVLVDTAASDPVIADRFVAERAIDVGARSLVLLRDPVRPRR